MSESLKFRATVLAAHGANTSQIEELLAYNQNVFDHTQLEQPLALPLASEPFVAVWEEYLAEAQTRGVFTTLQERLVQLCFPIQAGLSQSKAYQAATCQGAPVAGMAEATGLRLNAPDQLQLVLHQSLVGCIPLLITGDRSDFVSLVQALTRRNEPEPIPDSMGAAMVAGYNNWDRVRRYRQAWEEENQRSGWAGGWAEEFKRLVPRKALYQDNFIILSDGPYSGVNGAELNLTEIEWRQISLAIRREHEFAHYFTRRVFGSMRNNLIDEIIADYMGLVVACGRFRADWFLRFMGLEAFPAYRQGGRLENYRGQPPLSAEAFRVLQALVKSAVENLERLDRQFNPGLGQSGSILIALTFLTLEEIASEAAESRLKQALRQVTTEVRSNP
jgi:hypothetical protein